MQCGAAADPPSGTSPVPPDPLPFAPTSPTLPRSGVRLGELLPTLSSQLGVQVTADAGMANFPVLPMTCRNVPIRTALDLLVRQWPVAGFGYAVTPSGIRLGRR